LATNSLSPHAAKDGTQAKGIARYSRTTAMAQPYRANERDVTLFYKGATITIA